MSFLKQLFGGEAVRDAQASRMLAPFGSDMFRNQKAAAADLAAARRELMRSVLAKTLTRHGIPAAWLGAEMLVATARGRETGMHWRLLVKHWDPRLLTHAVALQNSLVVRLLGYDPLAADWLMGISWQFALPDEASCPGMPQPGYWTAEARPPASPPASQPRREQASGDVIAGPVRIASRRGRPRAADDLERDSLRQDLDQLLAIRDAELLRPSQHGSTEATQPMYLSTEPQPLSPARRRTP